MLKVIKVNLLNIELKNEILINKIYKVCLKKKKKKIITKRCIFFFFFFFFFIFKIFFFFFLFFFFFFFFSLTIKCICISLQFSYQRFIYIFLVNYINVYVKLSFLRLN